MAAVVDEVVCVSVWGAAGAAYAVGDHVFDDLGVVFDWCVFGWCGPSFYLEWLVLDCLACWLVVGCGGYPALAVSVGFVVEYVLGCVGLAACDYACRVATCLEVAFFVGVRVGGADVGSGPEGS